MILRSFEHSSWFPFKHSPVPLTSSICGFCEENSLNGIWTYVEDSSVILYFRALALEWAYYIPNAGPMLSLWDLLNNLWNYFIAPCAKVSVKWEEEYYSKYLKLGRAVLWSIQKNNAQSRVLKDPWCIRLTYLVVGDHREITGSWSTWSAGRTLKLFWQWLFNSNGGEIYNYFNWFHWTGAIHWLSVIPN